MARDQRRLAAIVSADVAGYSRLMGRDDSGTLAALKAHRRELIDPKIAEYGGRIVKTTGDGLLLEFPSVVDAVRCAVDVQRGMAERNAGATPEQRIDFRIGINVGDIIIDGDDIFGDGVNVAARLQMLAEPGAICVSRVVRDQVLDKLSFTFEDLGAQAVKNIARPVEVYRVDLGTGLSQAATFGHRSWLLLKRSSGQRWLGAGVLAVGLAGIAAWTVSSIWRPAPTTPPTMSVLVAPMTAPSGDAEVSRLAEVLTHNVATSLSRVGGYGSSPRARVVFVNTAAAGGSHVVAAAELARSLNVRYVLEGDVLRSGNGHAVNLRLVDGATGGQVWSQREAWEDADISAESSAKLRNLTTQLRNALQGVETRRVLAQPLSSLSAMELVLRAIDLGSRDQSLAGTIEAIKMVDEALRREPDLVPALITRTLFADRELDTDPDAAHRDRILRQYDEFTNRAISLDQTDPVAWDFRSGVLIYLGRWDAALEANTMQIKLDPDEAAPYAGRAWLMNMTGRPAEALLLVDRALAIAPANVGWTLRVACEAHLLLGQAEQGIATCEKARGLYQDDLIVGLFLAAAYANHGDLAKAAAAKADVLRIAPGYTVAQLRAKRYSDQPEYQRIAEKYWYEGLRKAGFPEQ
jgi:adenylate cyclase